MTTVQITLPDQLAQEAQQAGLLSPELLEKWLREQLRTPGSVVFRDGSYECAGRSGHHVARNSCRRYLEFPSLPPYHQI